MNFTMNRRDLLIGTASLAVSALPGKAAGAGSTTAAELPSALSASDREVRIIPAASREFTDLLDNKFSGLLQDETFESYLQQAAVIQHSYGPDLLALSIYWSFTTATGGFNTYLAKFQRPLKTFSDADGGTTNSASTEVLRANELMVITPFFAIRESRFKNPETINWTKVIHNGPLQQFLNTELPRVTKVDVRLDSGVFSDHRIVGTDQGRLAGRLQYSKRAEARVAGVLLRRDSEGASDQSLRSFLFNLATGLPMIGTTPNQRIFALAKKQYALYLLKLLKQDGRAAVVAAANQAAPFYSYKIDKAAA